MCSGFCAFAWLVFLVSFAVPRSEAPAQQSFSLGGPCVDYPYSGQREIEDAKKNGSWDQLIELEKRNVRSGCAIESRWYDLVTALLKAHRDTEAVQVLQEMDSRGLDLNP